MFEKEKEVGLRAVIHASTLCARIQRRLVGRDSITKEDKSPVTIADYSSQAVICKELREAFPRDTIVAEEDSKELAKPENAMSLGMVVDFINTLFPHSNPKEICSWIDQGSKEIARRYWALDPIDGTKGFLRRDQYAIALALIIDGKVQLGLLGCPNLPNPYGESSRARGCLFWAIRQKGAWQMNLSGEQQVPVRVSSTPASEKARFCESFEAGHTHHEAHARIARSLSISEPSLKMDSQAKYGVLARGEASIYLRLPSPESPDYREKVWDHAAGSMIVEEAGGRVTDIHGKSLAFDCGHRLENNRGVIATNGWLHEAVVEAVRKEI